MKSPKTNFREPCLILALGRIVTVEQPPPAPFEPASKPYWTAVKIVALILIILVGVSLAGVGLYYGIVPANVVSRTTSCTNGATNPPSCTTYPFCSNGAFNPPSCNNNVCTNGATNFPACNSYPPCSNGATPPSCNSNTGNFCLAFNFGDAEYSQNSTGWYITLYIQRYCSDRSLYVTRVSVNGTIFPGNWTLPPGYSTGFPFYSGPTTTVVVCMSCAGQMFIPCKIYNITVWVTGSGTSSGLTTPQSQGYGWECR
jgi:hypothetical protein